MSLHMSFLSRLMSRAKPRSQSPDRSSWHYPSDREARQALLSEPVVQRAQEGGEARQRSADVRTRMLAGAVMVEPGVLPHLAAAIERITALCPDLGEVECFVFNDPSVNAFVTPGRSRTLLAISSAAINHLDAPELEFILGHELGHAFFGHLDLAVGPLLESGQLSSPLAMRLRAWQRAAEISADRAGLMLCGSPEAAARALFKAASGIVAPGVATSPQQFAGQWNRLLSEVVEEGSRDFWQVSHPFPPLRMQAMLHFWEASNAGSPEAAVEEANRAVGRMLAMMDPASAEKTLHDAVLAPFFFWGGLHIALSDRKLDPAEQQRLGALVPPGETLAAAEAAARRDPELCRSRFAESVRARRRKLSAVELHRIIYGLIDVASADGNIAAEERERLYTLVGALSIPKQACDVILTQYLEETHHAA